MHGTTMKTNLSVSIIIFYFSQSTMTKDSTFIQPDVIQAKVKK